MTAQPAFDLLTIGHSNIPFAAFAANLKQHGVDLVVDVRTYPVARYATHFSRPALERALQAEGVGYRHLGKQLGGRPQAKEFRKADGGVQYGNLAASGDFQRGLAELERIISNHHAAIMCAEEDPARCHRHFMISNALAERGYAPGHIRKDGLVEVEESVAKRARRAEPEGQQARLLETIGEPQ